MTQFREYTTSRGAALQVDAERSIIEGVKILGLESRNGREYDRAAVQKAVGLYEGKAVNVDHVNPGQERSYSQRIGRINSPQLREDGLYGTLLVNPKHALAEQLLWDAQHMPENVGLSHDAEGNAVRRGNKDFVEEITRVRSVDLVSDPATTRGLFESDTSDKEKPMSKTLREIVQNAPKGTKGLDVLKRLIEEEVPMVAPEEPVEVAAEADPNEEVKAALKKAASAIVTKWFDGEIEDGEAMKKLKELKGMKDKAASDEGEVAPEPEPAAVESLRRRVADFEARDQARELLESEGIQPKAARVSALARCSSETERRSLLAEFPKDAGQVTEPRSTQPFREQRDPEWSPPKDAKEMAARLVG